MEKLCRKCGVLKPLAGFIYQRAAKVQSPEINIAMRIHSKGHDATIRLLCYNCNCGRQFAGGVDKICPHELERNNRLRLAS